MVVSELGELQILEVPIDSQQPKSLAVSAAVNQNLGPSYGLLDRSRIWVANRTLSRYQLQATRGQVITTWSRDREDRFLNPLRRIGEYLFHVRRRIGMQGATVTATPLEGSGLPAWQTDLGVPSNVVVGAGKVHAVTANGAMFSVQNAKVLRTPAARVDDPSYRSRSLRRLRCPKTTRFSSVHLPPVTSSLQSQRPANCNESR